MKDLIESRLKLIGKVAKFNVEINALESRIRALIDSSEIEYCFTVCVSSYKDFEPICSVVVKAVNSPKLKDYIKLPRVILNSTGAIARQGGFLARAYFYRGRVYVVLNKDHPNSTYSTFEDLNDLEQCEMLPASEVMRDHKEVIFKYLLENPEVFNTEIVYPIEE